MSDNDAEMQAPNVRPYVQERLPAFTQQVGLAELSAAIAHEVNQPLTAALANAYACETWLSASPPDIKRAQIASQSFTREVNRAANVVKSIRALFKKSPTARSPANINEVVLEVCQLMRAELRAGNVEVCHDLPSGLPLAVIDRVQIQQVLINLIRNAIEALGSTPTPAAQLRIRSLLTARRQICIEVADEAGGLQHPERLFEPFFTTKPDGMGMGLAICRSIVEAHNGRLWAEKNQPVGTRFLFTLPVWESTPQ